MNPVSGDPVVTNLACSPASAAPRGRRGFWALIATQFQGAFSDNILRNLLLSIDRRDGHGADSSARRSSRWSRSCSPCRF